MVNPAEQNPVRRGTPGDGRVQAKQGDADFKEGHSAEYPFGVLYRGPWETPWDGTCVAVRLHARALAATGIPILLESFHRTQTNKQGFPEPAHGNLHQSVIDEVGDLVRTEIATFIPKIVHLVVRDGEHLRSTLMPRHLGTDTVEDPAQLIEIRDALYRRSIAFTVWERDRVETPVVRQLSRCGQVWVPCSQNRDALVESGVPSEKVSIIPHPYDPESPLCQMTRRAPIKERRFYAISGAWQPRKGYAKLIGAFLLAFKPEDAVHLTIKYNPSNWPDYVEPRACLKSWLSDPAVQANGWTMKTLTGKLEMIEGRLDPDQIYRLHFQNNIYVASSHGEAWCLPAFDAKCAGNRMVHVPYGGTADFADAGDEAVRYKLGPAHPSYRWPKGSQWADFAVQDLADALRRVEPPEKYERGLGFEQVFSMRDVGIRMLASIMQVAAVEPKAFKHFQKCTAQNRE